MWLSAIAGFILLLTQLLVAPSPAAATTTIVPYQATGYRYLEVPAGQGPSGWEGSSFDESSWGTGDAAFGSGGGCPLQATVKTNWDVNTDMLLRKQITLPSGASGVTIDVTVDNNVKVYWNGTLVGSATHENCPAYNDWVFSVPDNLLASGTNLLAVRGSDNGFERFLDASVSAESEPSPDQPLISLGTLGPSTGVIGSSVPVGWDFSDADPGAVASDFTATIDWGDGTTASGGVTNTCVRQQCFFLVGGSHSYAKPGTFAATAHVRDLVGRNDSGGATVDIPATITIVPQARGSADCFDEVDPQRDSTGRDMAGFGDPLNSEPAGNYCRQATASRGYSAQWDRNASAHGAADVAAADGVFYFAGHSATCLGISKESEQVGAGLMFYQNAQPSIFRGAKDSPCLAWTAGTCLAFVCFGQVPGVNLDSSASRVCAMSGVSPA